MSEESGGAEGQELVPQSGTVLASLKQPRHRCPFYGFGIAPVTGGVLLDQQGNQCPLIVGRYSPCIMEMNGETPDWDRCSSFNDDGHRRLIEAMMGRCTIFPREFSAQGTSLRLWAAYVMDDPTVERPPKKDAPEKE